MAATHGFKIGDVADHDGWIDCGHGVSVGVRTGQELVNSEGVGVWEPEGYCTTAWLPKRCRNGKVRWLTWVDRHSDGTYTKCPHG